MESSPTNIPSPQMDTQAELEQLRAEIFRDREAMRITSAFYVDVLSKVATQEELLEAAIVMLREYLIGVDFADRDKESWAHMFENPFGLRAGWSTEGADGETAALALEAFDKQPGGHIISVPEANTYLVVPIPEAHNHDHTVGVIAIPVMPGAELDESVLNISLSISTSIAMHMDRVLRIVEASRSGQYAQAAARAQLQLNEPSERADALRIAIDALSECADLAGGIAFEVIDGAASVVAAFGLIDESIAASMVKGNLVSGSAAGYKLLTIILNEKEEAALVLTSKTSIEAVEDEMLGSIAAAVSGSIARSRATGTIETLRRSATRRLVEAQERERSMVAADIHDGVLQQLGATAIRLELAQARVEQRDFDTASTIIEEGAKEIRSCARELRALLMELRPQVLDDNGLNAALSELGRHVDGVEIEVNSDVPDDLGNEFSITIFRIVQEALTNIQKHAQAQHATVDVMLDGDSIQIAIRDDGIGYEGAVTGPSSEGSHLGLLGMRERARMLGGRFAISGGSGSGTLIEANLPLAGLAVEDPLI